MNTDGAGEQPLNWEQVEREQLLAFRSLPFAVKLQAVEEACELARHFQRRRTIREVENRKSAG